MLTDTMYTYDTGQRGTWRGDVILFGSPEGRIVRVSARGGTATALATLPWKPGQRAFEAPRLLPDGRHFLVSVRNDPALYVAALDSSGTRRLMEDGSSTVYAAGHLIYERGAGVFVRAFDSARLEFSGPEVQIAERPGSISASDDGTIVYRPTGVVMSTPTWFDRSGLAMGTLGEPGPYGELVLSPRGRRATVAKTDAQGNKDLWDADLKSGISPG